MRILQYTSTVASLHGSDLKSLLSLDLLSGCTVETLLDYWTVESGGSVDLVKTPKDSMEGLIDSVEAL